MCTAPFGANRATLHAKNRAPTSLDNNKKLSPLDYQIYKLRTNPKDKKSAMYHLVVKYYKVGTPEEWLQFMDAIAQGDVLQVFKNKEESQEIKDGLAFTKCC
eukprot:10810998-Ditylum_brightwellii.AAC.1